MTAYSTHKQLSSPSWGLSPPSTTYGLTRCEDKGCFRFTKLLFQQEAKEKDNLQKRKQPISSKEGLIKDEHIFHALITLAITADPMLI
jgi:hypothetical protein